MMHMVTVSAWTCGAIPRTSPTTISAIDNLKTVENYSSASDPSRNALPADIGGCPVIRRRSSDSQTAGHNRSTVNFSAKKKERVA